MSSVIGSWQHLQLNLLIFHKRKKEKTRKKKEGKKKEEKRK